MLRKAVHSEYYTTMRPGPDGLRNATLATHLGMSEVLYS